MNQKLLRRKAVEDLTGKSRSKIYEDMKKGDFPRPIRISKRSVRWTLSSVNEWIDNQIRTSEETKTQAND